MSLSASNVKGHKRTPDNSLITPLTGAIDKLRGHELQNALQAPIPYLASALAIEAGATGVDLCPLKRPCNCF